MAFLAPAHAQTPTPQQLQMFKNLPREQQQQLAAQYGITLPSGADSSKQSSYETTEPVPTRDPNFARELERNKPPELDEKGNKVLPRFGLSLFAGSPSTFAPVGDVPVPSSYTVGAGDEIIVQLFGQLNETHRLRVNRAGIINFPAIGPLPVAGMKFADVRRTIATRVEEQLIGVRSDVTLGELRTMQIFVAGDAYKPGAYTVSALTTMSQA
ncbi:MAG: polysaccharide biosynthesis/export family protein, partial [Vibrionaceae bacterium]